ncbi:MAG TPA: NAD(P)H-dependent oxidoreductase [Gemmatimonadales bacterium]|nr:NAD(P)H-dependent oxidoreductase [Gemmatimonadales bacterium]
MAEVRAVTLVGSLRAGSYNRALWRAAQANAPEGLVLEEGTIGDLPLYNADLQPPTVAEWPAPTARLSAQVAAADAVLFISPEYNYSIPGALKNAIDWVSRVQPSPFNDKPAAVMGATGGMWGTTRMQYHLRQVGVFVNLHFLQKPEMLVAKAAEKFSATGELTDEGTRKVLVQFLTAFRDWSLRIKGSR